MKLVLLVLSCLFLTSVVGWSPGFRVRFGVGLDYFKDLPRFVSNGILQGWSPAPRANQVLPSLSLYCPPDGYVVCVLFDDTGYLAGIQIAFSESEFTDAVYDWEVQGYSKWSPGDGDSYWATQQYFVNEEFLATSAEERVASRDPDKTLQVGGVWTTGIRGELVKLSGGGDTTGLLANGFTKQACIPLMGVHYFRNMTADQECSAEQLFPWFGLTDTRQELIASGLVVYGKLEEKDGDWFERPPRLAVEVIAPRGPECLYELAADPGLVTIHIYYINAPWTFFCL